MKEIHKGDTVLMERIGDYTYRDVVKSPEIKLLYCPHTEEHRKKMAARGRAEMVGAILGCAACASLIGMFINKPFAFVFYIPLAGSLILYIRGVSLVFYKVEQGVIQLEGGKQNG